jgi:hypothetical protein
MSFHMDTEHVTPMVNWAFVARQAESQARKSLFGQTVFIANKKAVSDFFADLTGANAPTAIPRAQVEGIEGGTRILRESAAVMSAATTAASSNADIDRIAKQRVQLMAARYASGTVSAEIMARLEILNQRLLESAPRVSNDQLQALERASEQLARIRVAREERSRRLGIPD